MKQHITKRQLKELSNDEILKLDKFMIDAGYYEENDLHPTAQANSKRKVGMNLSIGLMIEFLDEHGVVLISVLGYRHKTLPNFQTLIKADKWCDTLWEAVKEVLEQ